jgi:glycosyltransferase involved in cell wall biosynthesis
VTKGNTVKGHTVKGHVVMGLLFFPRGGSAQVARYLAPCLTDAGWTVSLVTGSLGRAGEETHAGTFFAGVDVHPLDYSAPDVPMHPSYEDRPGAPDPVLARVPPSDASALAALWDDLLVAAGGDRTTLFHLHHLTPQHEAVLRRWPDATIVAHLHGTELKFLEAVERAPDQWPHGRFWAERLRALAGRCDHLVAVNPEDTATAVRLLDVEPERVTAIPNGVDIEHFRPRVVSPGERRARLREWLVDDARGRDESGGPLRYCEAALELFARGPTLLFVGRFTEAKRVPLLVRAYARARPRFDTPAPLLVWGGHAGEWEGEHPYSVAQEVGAEGVFFTGWRGHDDLARGLAQADVLVMPSVNDSFPQTPLEAMATGLPVVATTSGGFPSMVNTNASRPDGWLVPPDDVDALADALVTVVNGPDERSRRAANALAHARSTFSWAGLVPRFEEVYARACVRSAARSR